ncbi:MAG: hypothetical protein JXB88_20655 [Spirochaetales bacterium]|nr:hypothetical protein [Spirochaetales bacterium]
MITRGLCTILFLSALMCLFPGALDGEEIPATGNFRWVLGRIMPDDNFHTVTDYVLADERPENELLLYVLPISNSYLYLFTLSTQQEFRLIFPGNFSIFNKTTYHYTPREFHKADILPFDSVHGGEICMLVSTSRLRGFEKLADAYRSAPESRKIMLFADILMELTRLHCRRYLAHTAVIPWESGSIPSHGETAQGKQIELTAQEFNYYFMAVFRYACE